MWVHIIQGSSLYTAKYGSYPEKHLWLHTGLGIQYRPAVYYLSDGPLIEMRWVAYGFLITGQEITCNFWVNEQNSTRRQWFSPEGYLRSSQFPMFWTEIVTLAQVCHLTQICHEQVLIRPHKEIPEIEKAIYFQCDVMASSQISRRFSSWGKFINNNLVISPGAPRDPVSPG